MREYRTIKQVARIFAGSDEKKNENHIRRIQKKLKIIHDQGNPDNLAVIKLQGINYIHLSIIDIFRPVYEDRLGNPTTKLLTSIDWDFFCTAVPLQYYNLNNLIRIMSKLLAALIKKTKLPAKFFVVVEYQPRAQEHLHFLIQTDYTNKEELKEFITETLDKLTPSDIEFNNDIQFFDQELKAQCINYLQKGDFFTRNYREATMLMSLLMTKGVRA